MFLMLHFCLNNFQGFIYGKISSCAFHTEQILDEVIVLLQLFVLKSYGPLYASCGKQVLEKLVNVSIYYFVLSNSNHFFTVCFHCRVKLKLGPLYVTATSSILWLF